MADKLHFSLVSPEREVFSGDVDQVDVPGMEGDFGVLADHAPFMSAIRPGNITVFNDGQTTKYYVQGGFADVTPAGLTILAEVTIAHAEVSKDELRRRLDEAEAHLESITGDEARMLHLGHIEELKILHDAAYKPVSSA